MDWRLPSSTLARIWFGVPLPEAWHYVALAKHRAHPPEWRAYERPEGDLEYQSVVRREKIKARNYRRKLRKDGQNE